jgi:hypothetical protein
MVLSAAKAGPRTWCSRSNSAPWSFPPLRGRKELVQTCWIAAIPRWLRFSRMADVSRSYSRMRGRMESVSGGEPSTE